jgi:hypothetical protein
LTKFTFKNIDRLPVVYDNNPQELIGGLNRSEVIAYYILQPTGTENEGAGIIWDKGMESFGRLYVQKIPFQSGLPVADYCENSI